MFDKKTKRGIIHHARQRRTESACRFEFEIHHFIYFPTPLYTKARCQAGFCVCWGFFLFEKSSGRQCTRPIEQLLSAATPPVKMQARKVRRLSGLVLSQNIIPLMIAGAQRRRFRSCTPIRPDTLQSSAGLPSSRCPPDTARPPGIPPPARCRALAWGRQGPVYRRAAAPLRCAPGR